MENFENRKGKVLAINISDQTGEIKHPIPKAMFLEDQGIEGDAHCGKDDIRQVSLLANESVDTMREMGLDFLVPGIFAENITTEGLVLKSLPIGTKLKIGDSLHEVSKIGKECHNGCAIKEQTGTCVMPTEGIFTRVISGGLVEEGDSIEVL